VERWSWEGTEGKEKNEKRDGKERGSREGLINPGCGPD